VYRTQGYVLFLHQQPRVVMEPEVCPKLSGGEKSAPELTGSKQPAPVTVGGKRLAP
jgi:hypothetical protein